MLKSVYNHVNPFARSLFVAFVARVSSVSEPVLVTEEVAPKFLIDDKGKFKLGEIYKVMNSEDYNAIINFIKRANENKADIVEWYAVQVEEEMPEYFYKD